MTDVRLTWREVRLAALAGVDIHLYRLAKRSADHHGRPSHVSGWEAHIIGALGEWAVAKMLGAYWLGATSNAPPSDVAGLEVRSTTLEHGGLIVYRDDPDGAPFVLVTGQPPALCVRGWVMGGDAKQERWWRDDLHQPAYVVPQAQLRSPSELSA